MLNQLFATPVLQSTSGLTANQLDEICSYILELRSRLDSQKLSNRGGWHSSGNLFAPEHRQFPAITSAITRALFSYIGEAFSYRGDIELALTGWAVVNRPGDYNTIHNHAANLLSGALYVRIPPQMLGGAIHFQDPRLNLNSHDTPAMRRLGIQPPWHATVAAIQPESGGIVVFPSWLNHWVEPYESPENEALRIVVSFNATIR